MRRLTGWWLVDADARKEALRGRVVRAEEEDVGAARCRVRSAWWRLKWTCGTARRSSSGSGELQAWRGSARGDLEAPGGGQRRKAMAAGLVKPELSGEKRRWRVLSALGGNG